MSEEKTMMAGKLLLQIAENTIKSLQEENAELKEQVSILSSANQDWKADYMKIEARLKEMEELKL